MLCSKLSFLQGFPCKLALSSVCSIPEHRCPQSDPSPIPLSELNWSRASFILGSRETRLLCRLKGIRAVPQAARCENSCCVLVGWPDPSPILLGSTQQLAFKSKTISCVFVTHLQPSKTSGWVTNNCNPKQNSCKFSEETWGLGRARVPGHGWFYISVVLFSPQTRLD